MMTPWMRKIHKWIGLLIGLQLVLWMCSGLVMSLLDAERVKGSEFRRRRWPRSFGRKMPCLQIACSPLTAAPVFAISTGWLLDQPVYRLAGETGVKMVDALNGNGVEISADLAQRLAVSSYTGPGRPGRAELVEPSLETRAHKGKVWRVDFADAEDTSVYLSQQGDVLEHRNQTWRLFDFFWMLHIMDYYERKDFNNVLVVSTAVGGLWLALTGTWLLITSFRLAEFIPQIWRGRRELSVFAPDGNLLRTLLAPSGDTVFHALARQGLQLPSNCGGGQSCGLCTVRVMGSVPPPTSADRAQLAESKVNAGHRLACNLKIDGKLDIEVQGGSESWTELSARVASIRAVTPFLREIVLAPAIKAEVQWQPGSYLQIHTPEYTMSREQIDFPKNHTDDWASLELPDQWRNKSAMRRSYSLSCPVDQAGGYLTLLARFMHGKQSPKNFPPGRGSAYLYGLKEGDIVRFSGPFGDFAIQPGGREKVFIGGGAGMAPLRAMIRSLLEGGAKEPIHFWYGARSLRDAPYVDEISLLATRFANFKWQLVLSDVNQDSEEAAGLLTGLVHDVALHGLLRTHSNLNACDFYVCGPPVMLVATRAMLTQLGVDDARVAFDDFKI
ncbi:MAG: 2Fe-2S iron-sulfur cluster binding domain-containing protein [Betaproteobacteria bacterium]|nr:2Fe-2S iron-sulfur cluster binding domain-containing protein [Betaproteobacteria bacterium]